MTWPSQDASDRLLKQTARDLIAQSQAHEVTQQKLALVQAQRERLDRVLAVERGDQSQAPKGWHHDGMAWWRNDEPRRPIVIVRAPAGERRPLSVWYEPGVDGDPDGAEAPTALEAMEAADAVRALSWSAP